MDTRVGARFRALRHRLRLRQVDVARRARSSRSVVSFIERGRLERASLANLRAVAQALDAELSIQLRWRGGDLDRLMDQGHAMLVGQAAALLRARGWEVRAEISYSIYGERGSIDLLGWHEATRTLLVIEVKTDIVSVEETLRKHDAKVRLARRIAHEQLGWRASAVGRLLVLPGLATPRRRVERHASVLQVAYPARGSWIRSWLREPTGSMSGILFLQASSGRRSEAIGRRRIRNRAA
jgi:transcriptional regulator with XRE-family HTH domain